MRLRDRLVVLLVCSAVLGLLTTLLGHVSPEAGSLAAGAATGLPLVLLVARRGGDLGDVAVVGLVSALLGTLMYVLTYYAAACYQLQQVQQVIRVAVLERLAITTRSGVLVVTFLTGFLLALVGLFVVAGLAAVLAAR